MFTPRSTGTRGRPTGTSCGRWSLRSAGLVAVAVMFTQSEGADRAHTGGEECGPERVRRSSPARAPGERDDDSGVTWVHGDAGEVMTRGAPDVAEAELLAQPFVDGVDVGDDAIGDGEADARTSRPIAAPWSGRVPRRRRGPRSPAVPRCPGLLAHHGPEDGEDEEHEQ